MLASVAFGMPGGMTMKCMIWNGALALTMAACATPEVVQVDQVGDEALACGELQAGIAEANRFEEEARSERGVTGTNVAAGILFWPALVGTYMNTDEAIDAARARRDHLTGLHRQRGCGTG